MTERGLGMAQTIRFLHRELVYFLQKCARASGAAFPGTSCLDAIFFRSAQACTEECLTVVRAAEAASRRIAEQADRQPADRDWKAIDKDWVDAWVALRQLPEEMQHLLISSLQRRVPTVAFLHYPDYPGVALRFVHPAYPLEIRAVESVSYDAFTRLGLESSWWPASTPRPGGAGAHRAPPRIAVTNQATFRLGHGRALGYFPSPAWRPGSKHPVQKHLEEYRSRLASWFNLYRLDMPRWQPAMLRFAPLVAHEHAHIIIAVLDLFVEAVLLHARHQKKDVRAAARTLDPVWGEKVQDLGFLYMELRDIWCASYPFVDLRDSDQQEPYNQLKEFLCDLLGLYACNGLPYYWAALLGLESRLCDRRFPIEIPLIKHPPIVCRLLLMRKVLVGLDPGFTPFVEDDETAILDILRNAAKDLKQEEAAATIEQYWGWLDELENEEAPFQMFLMRFAKHLEGVDTTSPGLDASHFGGEGQQNPRIQQILDCVCSGRLEDIRQLEATPMEVVGAAWWRLRNPHQSPPRGTLQLAWRQAIVQAGEALCLKRR